MNYKHFFILGYIAVVFMTSLASADDNQIPPPHENDDGQNDLSAPIGGYFVDESKEAFGPRLVWLRADGCYAGPTIVKACNPQHNYNSYHCRPFPEIKKGEYVRIYPIGPVKRVRNITIVDRIKGARPIRIPKIRLNPNRLSFSETSVGSYSERWFSVKNVSNVKESLSVFFGQGGEPEMPPRAGDGRGQTACNAANGPSMPEFEVFSTSCIGELSPGKSCDVGVRFKPSTGGELQFNVYVTSYSNRTDGGGRLMIPVQGIGVDGNNNNGWGK